MPLPEQVEARFNALLERHGKLLRDAIASRCARHLGLNFDDIMQEVRIRLWRAIAAEREIRDVRSYLCRIASTVTIDAIRNVQALREEQMHCSMEEDGPSEKGNPSHEPADVRATPEVVAEQRHVIAIVRNTLSHLPANRRRAVTLHLEGLSTVEIAKVLGWSEPKARNLVYRGLDDLRVQLRALGYDYDIE